MQPKNDTFRELDEEPEMHRERRKRILRKHPEIRRLFGNDPGAASTTYLVFAAHLLLAVLIAKFGAQFSCSTLAFWILVLAYFVGSILSHWLGMAIHETSHDLIYRSRKANRRLALFANLPMIVPIAMTFHRYHIDHHNLLGIAGEDTDLPHPKEALFVGNSRFLKFLWLFFYMLIYGARGLTFVQRPNRWELLNAGLQIGFALLIIKFAGFAAFCYLLLSTYFGHSLHPVAAHFVHEHYLFQPGQETYSYYGPLNRVTFNVGYHVEHHDFMNVPGSRLPTLHAIARDEYAPLTSHRSWTAVLWRFVWDRKMSLMSRRVRTRDQRTPRVIATTWKG